MIAATFNAWQVLGSQGIIKAEWRGYLRQMGLIEKINYSDEYLKNEAEQALQNVENILGANKLNV